MSQRQNSPNVQRVVFVDRAAQMSPQVRRGVHFFDENNENEPNSGVFFGQTNNIIPRKNQGSSRQVTKMISGISMGFQIDSDQAVYNS